MPTTEQEQHHAAVPGMASDDRTTHPDNLVLVVGHMKFTPHWCFGLFKRLYRKTKLGSLSAIAQVTDDSAKCNFA